MDFEKEINDLKKRIDSLTQSFLQSQKNNVSITEKADDSHSQIPIMDEGIKANADGVKENDNAICDVAELSDVNSMAIDDIAEMIDDLEQRVAELEEK